MPVNSKYYPFLQKETSNEADDNWTFKDGTTYKNTLLKGLEVYEARTGGNFYVIFPNADMESFTSEEQVKEKYWDETKNEYVLPEGARLVTSTVKNHVNSHRNHKQDVNTAQYAKEGQLPLLLSKGKFTFLGYKTPEGNFIALSKAKPIGRIGNRERSGIFTHGQARAINTFLSQYVGNRTLAQLDLDEAKVETQPVVAKVSTSIKASTPDSSQKTDSKKESKPTKK